MPLYEVIIKDDLSRFLEIHTILNRFGEKFPELDDYEGESAYFAQVIARDAQEAMERSLNNIKKIKYMESFEQKVDPLPKKLRHIKVLRYEL